MQNKSNKEIEILVRAIIQNKSEILVCKKVGKDYYFFPGGHIEFGESAKEALKRELKEELGLTITPHLLRTKGAGFIGGSEHKFTESGKKYHEINLAFDVKIDKLKFQSREDHLEFFLIHKNKLSRTNILPIILRDAVSKWLKAKRPFWVSEILSLKIESFNKKIVVSLQLFYLMAANSLQNGIKF